MGFKDRYGYDKKKAEDGTWVDKGDDFHVLLRRLNSKKVRDANTAIMKRYSHLTKGGKQLPTDIQDLVSRKLVSEYVLLDWKGAGAPTVEVSEEEAAKEGYKPRMIEYTPEVGNQYFIDFPDFLEEIADDAGNIDNFRREEREEIEGNS